MKGILRFLASARLTAIVLIVIAGVSAYGSLLTAQRSAMVYSSDAFALLLALLFVNLLLGIVTRLRRTPADLLIRAGFILVLLGAFSGRMWGERGVAQLYQGQETAEFKGPQGSIVSPGFALRLDRFEVERYPHGELELGIRAADGDDMTLYPVRMGEWVGPESLRVKPLRYLPDFKMDAEGNIHTKSSEPNNPALEVEVEAGGESESGWLFARFPHFPPVGLSKTLRTGRIVFFDRGSEQVRSYRSEVTLLREGCSLASGTVEVNRPMKFGGYRIYQSAYDPVGWQWSGLEIVRDPGLPLVYLGYLCLALGFTLWVGRGSFGR